MNSKEAYFFWSLANLFIQRFDYRIIQLFENQQELWLEKRENRHAPIIRIILHHFDWGNLMQRDIEFTAANGERIRKQLNRTQIHVINIYISEFPPVDEYKSRFDNPYVFPDGNKTTVHSYLLTEDGYEPEIKRLSDRMQQVIPLLDYHGETAEDVEMLKRKTLEHAKKQARAERSVLNNGKPLFTYTLIIITIAVFLWEQLNGGSTNTDTLVKYGAKVNDLIYQGEWWRFITPMFLHIGIMHLALNMLSLYYLGVTVERIFGNVRFLFIYLFAGLIGDIASFLFSPYLSAGASGAIYGCFGALLYFGVIFPRIFYRTMGINLFVILGINLAFSFSAPGIDSSGHIGGLLGGFLAAGIVHFPKKKKWILQLLFLMGTAVLVWGSLTYAFNSSFR